MKTASTSGTWTRCTLVVGFSKRQRWQYSRNSGSPRTKASRSQQGIRSKHSSANVSDTIYKLTRGVFNLLEADANVWVFDSQPEVVRPRFRNPKRNTPPSTSPRPLHLAVTYTLNARGLPDDAIRYMAACIETLESWVPAILKHRCHRESYGRFDVHRYGQPQALDSGFAR